MQKLTFNCIDASESKYDKHLSREHLSNVRYANTHSYVVYFNNKCYKANGSELSKDGFSWRTVSAKYHIIKDDVYPDTNLHKVYTSSKGEKVLCDDAPGVEWPKQDEVIYNEIMKARRCITKKKIALKRYMDHVNVTLNKSMTNIRKKNIKQ